MKQYVQNRWPIFLVSLAISMAQLQVYAQESEDSLTVNRNLKIITETDGSGNIISVDTIYQYQRYSLDRDTLYGDFEFDDLDQYPGFNDTLYNYDFDFEPYFDIRNLRLPRLPDIPPFPDFKFDFDHWQDHDSTWNYPDMESFYRSFPMDEFRKSLKEFRMEMDTYFREFYLHRDSLERIKKKDKQDWNR
jgi:hypothetical protein